MEMNVDNIKTALGNGIMAWYDRIPEENTTRRNELRRLFNEVGKMTSIEGMLSTYIRFQDGKLDVSEYERRLMEAFMLIRSNRPIVVSPVDKLRWQMIRSLVESAVADSDLYLTSNDSLTQMVSEFISVGRNYQLLLQADTIEDLTRIWLEEICGYDFPDVVSEVHTIIGMLMS